ncbi:glycosyltransferase family 4 protein [Chloroflexota bacterium]
MRILQVSVGYSPAIGGIAQHVKNISERLAGRHEVTVFTQNHRGIMLSQEEINGVLVKRFKNYSFRSAYHLSFEMIRDLRKSEFDIVHGHGYHALPLYFSRFAKRKKFVITTHYHGQGHTAVQNLLLKLYKPLGRRIFTEADAIITVSNFERELIIRDFGVCQSKVRMIPNGIVRAEFAGRRDSSKKAGIILYVGRLEEYKGVQYIIRTLPLLDDDYRLEIVGSGSYHSKLVDLADQLGVSQRVMFHGFLDRDELIDLYFKAGLLVLLSKREAFSIVVAEALAAGTPCIVANTSALKEWVDNKNCFGIDYPISIAQLAEAIKKMTGKKATDVKLWDWDDVAREVEQVYELNQD